MNHGILPYIGGKHRIAKRLMEICRVPNRDLFVDVFGGSAAVMLAASDHFPKLVYNDADGDLVNLFRVMAADSQRIQLFRKMRALPVSRRVFEDDYEIFKAGCFSVSAVACPVERARMTLYRQLLCFGGKRKNGGFQASSNDPDRIKEVQRYRNSLRKLARVGATFRRAIIENLDYQELITVWGKKPHAVLFVDPPYHGSEVYYAKRFGKADHVFLAHQLATVQAHVVLTYYRTPLIEALYPESRWHWQSIAATKNCALIKGNKVITNEWVISRK